MRKIKIEEWKSQANGEEVNENLIMAFNVLIASKKPEELPRGLEKFKIFGRLNEAFEKSNKSKVLELEEAEYEFLKSIIEKDIPSTWGMNKGISKAVNDFLGAREE